jgi:tungstate transport system substrate-binding protein
MLRSLALTFFILCIAAWLGCSKAAPSESELTLVSTTTTQDSGLLDVLVPAFEKQSGITVKVIAVGSGQALELGRRGDADVLLTHSPEAEKKFMDEGWGDQRRAVMHNDFVIVGPADDKAAVKSATSATEALQKISQAQTSFISRSDESGTHVKEKSLWKAAEIAPSGDWYIQAGTGMAPCLRMAHEKQAYILCDRATFLALKEEIQLVVLHEGDERLLNRYSVITLNPQKHPQVHQGAANQLATFLLSPGGQALIRDFGKERYGQSLFTPDASQ